MMNLSSEACVSRSSVLVLPCFVMTQVSCGLTATA